MENSDETSFNEFKINSKLFYTILIFAAVGLIIGSTIFIFNEIYQAKKTCEDLGFEHKFIFPNDFLCNNKTFLKYSNGWSFSREINYSGIKSPTLIP